MKRLPRKKDLDYHWQSLDTGSIRSLTTNAIVSYNMFGCRQ